MLLRNLCIYTNVQGYMLKNTKVIILKNIFFRLFLWEL